MYVTWYRSKSIWFLIDSALDINFPSNNIFYVCVIFMFLFQTVPHSDLISIYCILFFSIVCCLSWDKHTFSQDFGNVQYNIYNEIINCRSFGFSLAIIEPWMRCDAGFSWSIYWCSPYLTNLRGEMNLFCLYPNSYHL